MQRLRLVEARSQLDQAWHSHMTLETEIALTVAYFINVLAPSCHRMSPSDYDLVCNVYSKLTPDELLFFLKVRNLPTAGPASKQITRLANHDLHTYDFPPDTFIKLEPKRRTERPVDYARRRKSYSPEPGYDVDGSLTASPLELPIEIIADIMDHLGDWELATAVGVPTRLTRPPDWNRATPMDHLLLLGDLQAIQRHTKSKATKWGAMMAVRMSHIPVLDHLLSVNPGVLKDELVPVKASRYGRTDVLGWYKHLFTKHPHLMPFPSPHIISQSIEAASRRGQVASLDWWLTHSSLSPSQLYYTESALEHASSKAQIPVLEWWKSHADALPLKIGRVMDMASGSGSVSALAWWASNPQLMQCAPSGSANAILNATCNGRIEVLDWWFGSGLQFSFDNEVLVNATKHDRADVLSWWEGSGLDVRLFFSVYTVKHGVDQLLTFRSSTALVILKRRSRMRLGVGSAPENGGLPEG